MITGTTDSRLESVGSIAVNAPNNSIYWFSFHHVAALSYRSDRLGHTGFRARGYCPTFTETATGVCCHVEFYAAGYTNFSCMTYKEKCPLDLSALPQTANIIIILSSES